MKRSDQLKKKIFNTVYTWGRVGVVVDANSDTFTSFLKEYARAVEDEKYTQGDFDQDDSRNNEIGARP